METQHRTEKSIWEQTCSSRRCMRRVCVCVFVLIHRATAGGACFMLIGEIKCVCVCVFVYCVVCGGVCGCSWVDTGGCGGVCMFCVYSGEFMCVCVCVCVLCEVCVCVCVCVCV